MSASATTPNPEAVRLWRYIDFPRLIATLENGALFFQPPSSFNDPFEGAFHGGWAEPYIKYMGSVIDLNSVKLKQLVGDVPNKFSSPKEALTVITERLAKSMIVSCWHQSDIESEAMWKLYAASHGSVAVTTNAKKLHDILPPGRGDVVPVQYIDYAMANERLSLFNGIFHKRKSFEHEREYRAFFIDVGQLTPVLTPTQQSTPIKGSYVKIPQDFFDEIIISPYSPAWVAELIPKLMERYGLRVPVRKSKLGDGPEAPLCRLSND